MTFTAELPQDSGSSPGRRSGRARTLRSLAAWIASPMLPLGAAMALLTGAAAGCLLRCLTLLRILWAEKLEPFSGELPGDPSHAAI